MTQQPEKHSDFLGTYFDRDGVLKLVRATNVLSWVVAIVYGLQLLLSVTVFGLQVMRGMMVGLGPTDYVQQVLYLIEIPFRGVVYFFVLQAAAKALLIFLDVEDNTRRAARGTSGAK